MNILSSVVPGIRELRTPITSGLLWISAIVVFGISHHVVLMPSSSTEIKLRHLSSISATLFLVPAIFTGALLVGNVMIALIDPLVHFLGRRARRSMMKLLSMVSRFGPTRMRGYFARQNRLFEARTRTIGNSARGLVMEADSRALAKVGVPGSAAMMFPLDEVLDSLKLTAPQLSRTAETQYQEYDRVRSEAQFRVAVVPPLIALAAVLPINGWPWILAGTIIAGLVLLFQSVGQERQAMDMLANAAYLGYISIPMVQSVAEYLSGLSDKPEGLGQWVGAMIRGLGERGHFEEQHTMMYEAAELDDTYLDEMAEYFAYNDMDLSEWLTRIIERKTKALRNRRAVEGASHKMPDSRGRPGLAYARPPRGQPGLHWTSRRCK